MFIPLSDERSSTGFFSMAARYPVSARFWTTNGSGNLSERSAAAAGTCESTTS